MRIRAARIRTATKTKLRMIRAKIKIKKVKSPSSCASISRTSDNAFWHCLFRRGIMWIWWRESPGYFFYRKRLRSLPKKIRRIWSKSCKSSIWASAKLISFSKTWTISQFHSTVKNCSIARTSNGQLRALRSLLRARTSPSPARGRWSSKRWRCTWSREPCGSRSIARHGASNATFSMTPIITDLTWRRWLRNTNPISRVSRHV